MATTSAELKKPTTAKQDAYIRHQLRRAGGRVRSVDVVAGVLVLLVLVLAYTLLIPALDYQFRLSTFARMCALGGLVLGLILFVAYLVLSLMFRHVNPYYAARRLEKTVPRAKESLTTWLDLNDQSIPPVFRDALSAQAAKDLSRADMDHVAATRRNWWLAGILAVLLLPLIVFILARPAQTASLLGRAFFPVSDIEVARNTQLELLAPAGGNAFIAEKEPVHFRVSIRGRVPAKDAADAPLLQYRFGREHPYVEQALANLRNDIWATKLLASQIVGGKVYYKITAGDAATDEYVVEVRADPQVLEYRIAYLPREYRQWQKHVVQFPNEHAKTPAIKEYEGTEAILQIQANRSLKSASLELQCGDELRSVPGKPVAGKPRLMQFNFVLERFGTFKVLFTSEEDEANIDKSAYPVEVLKDEAPVVKLTQPGKDVKLPANGLLQLEGLAEDDFGIKQMALRMQLVEDKNKAPLLPKLYREGKSFRLPDGSYPDAMRYGAIVYLQKLKNADESPLTLKAGMVLEYWLEATDSCDFPDAKGHLGKSKLYKVLITEPEKDQQKLDQQKKQAQKKQEQHQKEQDKNHDQLKKEVEKQQQARKSEQPKNAGDQNVKKKLNELEKALKDLENRKKNANAEQQPNPQDGKDGKGKTGDNANPKAKQNEPAKNQQVSQKKESGKGEKEKSAAKGMGQEKSENSKPDEANQGAAKGSGEKQPQSQAKGAANQKQNSSPASARKDQPQNPGSQVKPAETKGGQPESSDAKEKNADAGQKTKPAACRKKGGNGSGKSASAKNGEPNPANADKSEQPAGGPKAGPKTGNERIASLKQNKAGAGQAEPSQKKSAGAGASDQTGKVAQAKGQKTPGGAANKSAGKKKSGSGASGAKDGPTNKDLNKIAQLEKQLQKAKDPNTRKQKMQELKKLADQAKDERARQAAAEALRRANGEKTAGNKDAGGKKTGSTAPNKTPGSKPGQGNDIGKKNANSAGKPIIQPEPQSPGQGEQANIDFAKKGGNLQLEELKKILADPKVRKQLQKKYNWTDDDIDRFLRQLKNYQQQKSKGAAPLPPPGSFAGQLKSSGPRQIGASPRRNPLAADTGRAPPPPEYEEAFQRLTGGAAKSNKQN